MLNIDFSIFTGAGFRINGILHVSPFEAYACSARGAVIVDLREPYETNFRVFDVGNVIYLPMSEFRSGFSNLPQDKALILADAVGLRSKEAILILLDFGYTNLANLNGGMVDWDTGGLPVCRDIAYELNGQCACKLRARKGSNPLKDKHESPSHEVNT